MSQKFILKADTKLFVGNVAATLPADTEVVFETVGSRDHLAEVLAASPSVYAAHREALAHEVEEERDGARVRVRVTYGVGGVRAEEVLGPVEEKAAVQTEENRPDGGPAGEEVEFDSPPTPDNGGESAN